MQTEEKRSPLSGEIQASITVETALVLPLFLLGLFSLISLFSLFEFGMNLQAALYEEAKTLSLAKTERELKAGTGDGSDRSPAPAGDLRPVTESMVSGDILALLDEGVKRRAPVAGGLDKLDFSGSLLGNRELIVLSVSYEVRIPFLPDNLVSIPLHQQCLMHTWIGYEKGLFGSLTEGEDPEVYVTKTGTVYHSTLSCSHIRLSIRETTGSEIGSLRNEDGGKYKPCQSCHAKKTDAVLYYTLNGDRYHNSLSCSGLRRWIRAMKRSEAVSQGFRPCSRCGGSVD
ncbi:MAG: hypothetical protein K6G83_07400 [Lachnospiraceae bacterium]|nr:hypothetical protein [Lachnospiraceae bacterium]